ncbi:MAG: hypothetical protein WBL20_21260 [Sphingobium sp.]
MVEHLIDALAMNTALVVAGKFRLVFEETLDLGLRLEAPGGIALQRLADDGSQWLLRHEYLVLAPAIDDLGELIANRRLEHPIAIEAPRAHPVERLLGILLALMLVGACKDILDETAIAVLAELVRRGNHDRPRALHRFAQLLVGDHIARKARQVVDDHIIGLLLAAQEGEHFLHRRSGRVRAGEIVLKDADHIVAVAACIFAADGFLTFKAMAIGLLFGVGHTAVYHRLLPAGCVAHVSFFPAISSVAAALKSSCAIWPHSKAIRSVSESRSTSIPRTFPSRPLMTNGSIACSNASSWARPSASAMPRASNQGRKSS